MGPEQRGQSEDVVEHEAGALAKAPGGPSAHQRSHCGHPQHPHDQRRPQRDAEETQPALAAEAGAFVAARYVEKERAQNLGLVGEALVEARRRLIDDANVPIDNSPTERERQTVTKLRLNLLFADSTEGAH